jgi:hypothetical protein
LLIALGTTAKRRAVGALLAEGKIVAKDCETGGPELRCESDEQG